MAEESRPADHHPSSQGQEHRHKMAEDLHGKHHLDDGRLPTGYRRYAPRNRRTALSACIITFLLLAGIIALVLWLVYRPHHPQFTVSNAAVYTLNTTTDATAPPYVSAVIQFTIVTRNPNERVSILYESLSAFVTYRNQMITQPVTLPPLYQERRSTVAMSPVLGAGGMGVPVPGEVANGLMMDEGYGVVGMRVVLVGKVRYKAGAIWSGRYGIYVKCDVLLGFKTGLDLPVGQVPLLPPSPHCLVHT